MSFKCVFCVGPRSSTPLASITSIITPEQLKPFPKAGPRKTRPTGNRMVRRGSTRILTDTPVKNQIADEARKRTAGKIKNGSRKKLLQSQPRNPRAKRPKDEPAVCYKCGIVEKSTKDTLSWIQCSECKIWVHEQCGEDGGVFDDDHFYCAMCAAKL